MLSTVSDRLNPIADASGSLVAYYQPDITSATDYYPGGMLMPGRNSSPTSYRYGFNGKENDNEVQGTGNQQDYGMRIYDPRLGRFLSVDPLQTKFSFLSPYAYAANTPIRCVDLDGKEPLDYSRNWKNLGETYIGKWGQDVKNVHDKWTGQVWSVMNYPNHNQVYYWKPYDGSQGTFDYQNDGAANKDSKGNWTGSWQRFEKQETIHARLQSELVDKASAGFAGVAAGLTALPAMVATGGGGLLSGGFTGVAEGATLTETVGMAVTKFSAGFISNIIAQVAADPNSKVNLIQAGIAGGTTMLNMNAWTGAALQSSVQMDPISGKPVLLGQEKFDAKQFAANFVLGGATGAATGRLLKNFDLSPIGGLQYNATATGANVLANFWTGTAANAGANAIASPTTPASTK